MNKSNFPSRFGAVPADRYSAGALDDQLYDELDLVEAEGQAIDLRALWSALYRNRYLVAGIVASALLLGIAATLLMTRVYRAQASVQIDQEAARVLGTEETATTAAIQDADRFLETQLDVLRSRYLAERVAQDLKLFGSEQFLDAMGLEAPDAPAGTLSIEQTQREAVLRTLHRNMSVSLPRNSRIARISFDSPDPVLAAEVANSYARNFVTSNLQRKFDTSSYAREFLSNQLQDAKGRLEASEREMLAYARSARLIDTSNGAVDAQQVSGPRSLTTSSLVQLNIAHSAAVAQRVQAQQRWAEASSTPPLALPEVLANSAVQELVQQRAEQMALYQQERQRRREGHPSVQQAAARIAELEDQIARLANNIKSGLRQQYQVALGEEQSLAGNISRLKGETLAEQDRSVRYNILKREADTNRQMYEDLLQRYRQVSAEAGVTSNNIAILDGADVPTKPVSPRPVLNMAAAGMGGLALALLLVFARERFDDAVRSPEDVESKLDAAVLGVIPVTSEGEKPLAALADPRSPLTEAYHALRTSLELSSSGGLPKSLLFTSSQQSEGKSTSAYATARDFARVGKKVVLIDADLRKPSLHHMMDASNAKGLSSLLARASSIEDVVRSDPDGSLDFIAAGPLPPNPAELLAAGPLDNLLAELASRYDLIVVDAPPVMGLSDAPLLASRVGGTVFVVEANRAHRGQAKIALKRLASTQARLLGVALTKFNARAIGYGQDYGYGYRYGD